MENFTFSKLEYVRPDFDAAEAKAKELTERVRNAKSYADVKAAILENDEYMSELQTMVTIANIRNTLNTTDEFYEKEIAFIQQRLPEIQGSFIEFGKAMVESPFAADLDASARSTLFPPAVILLSTKTPLFPLCRRRAALKPSIRSLWQPPK